MSSSKIYYNFKEKYYIRANKFPGEGFLEPILYEKKGKRYRIYKNKHGKMKSKKITIKEAKNVEIKK